MGMQGEGRERLLGGKWRAKKYLRDRHPGGTWRSTLVLDTFEQLPYAKQDVCQNENPSRYQRGNGGVKFRSSGYMADENKMLPLHASVAWLGIIAVFGLISRPMAHGNGDRCALKGKGFREASRTLDTTTGEQPGGMRKKISWFL